MMITDEQADMAYQAWIAYCERYVLVGSASGNDPLAVMDEETGKMIYGPADNAREWHGRQGMRTALSKIVFETCSCGSGMKRRELIDGHGVFMCFVCDECEQDKLKYFRLDIFEHYELAEPLDDE